ncbi:MAG: DUF721 domain-containing protein [Acidimicrobiia bacterium]|nr:DUF721 domain-containing protein [Acidimicrobiia bacterium]
MKNPWTGEDPDRGLLAVDKTLEAVLERVTEGHLATFELVKTIWPQVVGAEASHNSRPVRLSQGVLTVEVADGSTASRLRLRQAQIRSSLETHVGQGEIAQIRLRVGRRQDFSEGL